MPSLRPWRSSNGAAGAVAHVFEMQGRAADGVQWMATREPHWSGDSNFFKGHNWWHTALFHLDLDRPEQTLALYDAEVRKVNKEGGTLTLKHGDIKNLDMPGMTMVFAVKDKAMLDKVKAGDKIKFKAINDAGKFTVTEVQVVQ